MKQYRLFILALMAFVSLVTYGQLFKPLGLGSEKGELVGEYFLPQMHVEGDILYVCTNRGLYSKDLSNDESEWQLVGFEGIPLQDYARSGNDILALRYSYSYDEQQDFLLLSHDGGKTYEDVTPDLFKKQPSGWKKVLKSLVQHPADPSLLLVSSIPMGLFQSSDYGQSWNQLTDYIPDHTGYHPLNPEIIYESGESAGYWPYIRVSYDGGQTWSDVSPNYPGDNCVNRMAFHPTDPNKWIAGGFGSIYTTNDNAQSWNTQVLSGEHYALWRYVTYDNENSNIIYMVGGYPQKDIKLMCSTNEGTSWNKPYSELIDNTSITGVYDLKQYGDKLLIYTETDVYTVSKAELIEETSDAEPVTFTKDQMATIILPTAPDASKGKYYKLDRCEDGQIVFTQETQPQARTPYIIVPNEDFSINMSTLDVAGLNPDTVTVGGISFIGSYVRTELPALTGGDGGGSSSSYYDIIDQTPDCQSDQLTPETFTIGALRAYLVVTWDDPIHQGPTKGEPEKLEIVLLDEGTGISDAERLNDKGQMINDNSVYDLSGRKISSAENSSFLILNSSLKKGIYVVGGKKVLRAKP